MPEEKKTPEVPGKVGVEEKKLGAETNMPGATNPKAMQSESNPPDGEATKLQPSVQRPTKDGPAPSNETQEQMQAREENRREKEKEEQQKAFQERTREDKKRLDEMIENLTSYQASKEHDELEQVDKDRVARQIKALKEATDQVRQRITTFVARN